MYIFRIVSPVDKTKTWYKGEVITPTALIDVYATNPPGHPSVGVYAALAGDTIEHEGYLYSSLKDNNNDAPSVNYVGFPVISTSASDVFGKNTWVRTGYANKMLMLIPESCGITESYENNIGGTLRYPSGIPYVDVEKCVCSLFCGVLGSSITINLVQAAGIDDSLYETGIGNPEVSGLNKAFTTTSNLSGVSVSFAFSITKSLNSISTYCSGAYMGSWSYIGITQWTNHKKSTTDYSGQEQDEWGNYKLSKNRTGRTYSADVILKPRENAVLGDYDHNLKDLCYSVANLLQSQLGVVNAFYFNNQDIGVPWIPHNTNRVNDIIQLNDSDIIVGILKSFKITDMTGNRAVLSLTVDSVPNEYKNYTTIVEESPQTTPEVDGLVVCTAITSNLDGTSITVGLEATETFSDWLVVSPTNGTYNATGIIIRYSVPGVCTVTITEVVSIYGAAIGTSSVTITVPYWAATNTVQNKSITFIVNVA